MSPIVIDDRPRCPTCGHVVHVQTFDDGQTFYEPDEQEAVVDAAARVDGLPTAEALTERLREPGVIEAVIDALINGGLAALPAPVPPALDVERLARAMDMHVQRRDIWATRSEQFRTFLIEEAADIASFYARLSPPAAAEEPR